MAAIGGTYVVLVAGMLLADVIYMFTAGMQETVIIDFMAAANGDLLHSGDLVDRQFGRFGLTVSARPSADANTTSSTTQLAPRVFDSSQPPPEQLALGSPHADFGGPGVGAGGARSSSFANPLNLRNILIVGSGADAARDPGAPPGAAMPPVAAAPPVAEPATLTFRWIDPVRLESVRLLNVAGADSRCRLYDDRQALVAQPPVAASGLNGLQTVRCTQPGVARCELTLPAGAAIVDVKFAWEGRLRAPWETRYPLAARLLHNPLTRAFGKPEIRYSIRLTLISCTITTILSLWVAVPIGYLLSRHRFPGRSLIDALLDIPIVLPPLVVGLSLLILFQFAPASLTRLVVYQVPGVIVAQFAVACAFAVRAMRASFDQIDVRREHVALTLGCSRAQAFHLVVLPEARNGMLTAATLAWARSLGEFGPLLVFAGTIRNKTEVLSTTVFLELNVGNLGAAVAVSLIMVLAAIVVLIVARTWGGLPRERLFLP